MYKLLIFLYKDTQQDPFKKSLVNTLYSCAAILPYFMPVFLLKMLLEFPGLGGERLLLIPSPLVNPSRT